MKLTALIPAYNDAYTLQFCLASIGPHFQEIIVLDDASTDETPDVVLAAARAHPHIRYVRHEGAQLGWVKARQRLLDLADSAEHLFWLDADDVLCEYNAGLLRDVAQAPSPVVLFQLCEMWGDLYHTTQRLRHYDPCHVYTRRPAVDVRWEGCAMARLSVSASAPDAAINRKSPPAGRQAAAIANRQCPSGPLFFHLKGVKPDRRLVERAYTRAWLRQADRPAHLSESSAGPIRPMNPIRPISALSDGEVHVLALKHLFQSRQDRLMPTYRQTCGTAAFTRPPSGGPGCECPAAPECAYRPQDVICGCIGPQAASAGPIAPTRAPVRPGAILAALPGRFEIIYDAAGRPVDRIDHQSSPRSAAGHGDENKDCGPFEGPSKEDSSAVRRSSKAPRPRPG
jgi:hypothetical protein